MGVTVIILGMAVLTPSSTDQPTKTPITAKARSTALANSTSTTTPPSPAQSASEDPGPTRRISQRPALKQLPALGEPSLETIHSQETSLERIFIRVTGRELA